jgi:hypothetical protein
LTSRSSTSRSAARAAKRSREAWISASASARALQLRLAQRAGDGDVQQRDEIALRVLDEIIGGTGLERRDGDLGVQRGGNEHHRRGFRDRPDLLQRVQPIETRHVLIERDGVDAALLQPFQTLRAARRALDLETEPRQAAIDQPRQRFVIVDVEQRGGRGGHVVPEGTWMTEKNRPSWRMAFAKLS